MNEQQLMRDLGICKALAHMEGTGIRWYRCIVLSVNDLGQYHVRRLRTGEEAITTHVRNLTPADRKFIRANYL
jgi:hypothetical protein